LTGESDGDDLVDDHHYEALYEVINPRLQSSSGAAATHLDHNDDSFDDSFDSDDAFEEVVVRGLVIESTNLLYSCHFILEQI
jgi:hypothetical protein